MQFLATLPFFALGGWVWIYFAGAFVAGVIWGRRS